MLRGLSGVLLLHRDLAGQHLVPDRRDVRAGVHAGHVDGCERRVILEGRDGDSILLALAQVVRAPMSRRESQNRTQCAITKRASASIYSH